MSTPTGGPAAPPDAPPAAPGARTGALLRPVGAGVALLTAGAPVGAVVEGTAWWWYAGGAVALTVLVGVVAAGLPGAARVRPAGVAAAQLAAVAAAVTALFARSGVFGVVPGPAAAAELATLLEAARREIDTGVAPVPATPAMLLLLTGAFGLAAVAVHAVAVGARAPAAAGVLLLAVFAVPTALADDLLPAWMLAVAAGGYALLLAQGPAARGLPRPAPAVVTPLAVTAVAVALALAVGAAADGIGTAGRITGPAAGSARGPAGSEIGLSPFTALRGQLQQGAPTELFRVTGLPRPAYLRALTLSSYVADAGWQPGRPGTGTALTGELPAVDTPGDRVRVTVENVGFRDYWLPLYGEPLGVTGVAADRWAYDPATGTAYTTRARREDRWTQEALLPTPSEELLRAAGPRDVDALFSDTTGIDPRVADLATEVTADARTPFDRAVALNTWFSGPGSAFTYDLSTGRGNGDDAMVEFLTTGRRGYCEQYASAMAAMLRTVGVPARVAVGFTTGPEAAGTRTVRTSDAHAWVEAWLPGPGWTTFDPTPLGDDRAAVPPYAAQASPAGTPDAAATATTAPPEPPDGAERVPDAPTDTAGAGEPPPAPAAPPAEPASGVVRHVLLGLAAAAGLGGLLAVPSVLRSRRRSRRLGAAAAGGPGAAGAAWAELLADSADRGVPGVPTETVRDAAGRLADAHRLDGAARRALSTVVGLVEESGYGGVDPAPGALTAPLRVVLAGVAAGTPLPLRARLFPRSVTDELRPSRPGRGDDDGRNGDPTAGDQTGDALATRR